VEYQPTPLAVRNCRGAILAGLRVPVTVRFLSGSYAPARRWAVPGEVLLQEAQGPRARTSHGRRMDGALLEEAALAPPCQPLRWGRGVMQVTALLPL
jgi:hypothetical protein